jgi:hypothetical protein
MSVTASFAQTGSAAGMTFGNAVQSEVSAEAVQSRSVTLAAAKTGNLTTRTDANTGTLTMDGGHGITTGARIDIYFEGGCQRGVTVGTVSVNSVPFDSGVGDDLPDDESEVTVMVCDEEAHAITGDNAKAVLVYGPARSTVVFAESDDTEVLGVTIPAGGAFHWFDGCGLDNPLASGTITKIFLTHGDSAASQEVRVAVLHD